MKKITIACILALLLWAITSPAHANLNEGQFILSVDKGRIALQAEKASVKNILAALEEKTGLKVVVYEGVPDRKVTLKTEAIPIHAIGTILQQLSLRNTAIVFEEKLRNMALYVLPEGMDPSTVLQGKTIIRPATFPDPSKANEIKGKPIITTLQSKNNVPIRYVDGEILLKFHRGVTKDEIDAILSKYRLERVEANDLSRLGYVKVRIRDGRNVIDVIKEIRKEHKLKVPEPNYIVNTLSITDPLYSQQWYVPETRFDAAWDVLKSRSTVSVAVIDTGADADHPDLKGRVLKGYDFVNGKDEAADDHGHGTFVAGIIAASANDIGIRGLYDQARIIPVKAIDNQGLGTYEDVAKGIVYGADAGARIINLSIGGYAYSYLLQDAVDYALEKGCIMVAAGGNDGIEQPIYPAAYPDVIGVSALGNGGQIWSGSNSGVHIDVSAPGVNILSTGIGDDYVYTTGTSAAASMVSALAAMLLSEKPDLSSSVIESLIIKPAKDLGEKGRDKIYGSGEIDAVASLQRKVKPFHDIAVRSVHVEPLIFEKGKPTYIVANIQNVGTYKFEKYDVVLYEIIGEEKKQIGRKEGVNIIDSVKMNFKWQPKKIRENVKFEVLIISGNDSKYLNNSKISHLFSLEESNGLYVLHKNKPPVHGWIAYQAYKKIQSTNSALYNEMTSYIGPSGDNSSYLSGTWTPSSTTHTSNWPNSYSAPYCPTTPCTTAVIEGTWEEDEPLWQLRWMEHFWDPTGGYNDGLFYNSIVYDSALKKAQETTFVNAINNYLANPQDKNTAYYWLGRTAHLLTDMGVPAHTLEDQHAGYDSFEEYVAYNEFYKRYNSTHASEIPQTYSSTPATYDSTLTSLFYGLANKANNYDTDDYYGEVSGGVYNKFDYKFNLSSTLYTHAGAVSSVIWYKQCVNGNTSSCESSQTLTLGTHYEYDIGLHIGELPAIYVYDNVGGNFDENDMGIAEGKYDVLKVTYKNSSGATTVEYLDNYDYNLTYYYDLVPSSIFVEESAANHNQHKTLQSYTIGNVAALYRLFWERTHATLTVTKSGTGSGTLTSSPSGINCGSTCNADFVKDVSVTLTASASSDSTFSGWSGSGCSGTGTCTVTMNQAKTVTASFLKKTYTVSYNANGATSGSVPSPQTKIHDAPLTLSGNTGSLARTGYTLTGWNTNASGMGTHYALGGTYTANASITLYAEWTAIPTYTVSYNANGATSGSAPSPQTKIHNENLILSGNTGNLARTGYTLTGWNTNASGTGSHYALGGTYTANASITLYAEWTAIPTYTVSYNANGATSGSAPSPQTKIHDAPLTLSGNTGSLARTGYTLTGWNTNAGGTGTHYDLGGTYTANASITLYAEWTIGETYTLNVNSSGASSVYISASPLTYAGTTNYSKTGIASGTSITLTAPSTSGSANFSNWSGCNSTSGTSCTVSMTSDKTVTANYTTLTYTFYVNSSGASSVSISASPSTYGGTTNYSKTGIASGTSITLTAPATSGSANFSSWTGCNSTSGTSCTVSMTSDKTVTANYSIPTPVLTVSSINPASGVSITVSPNDNSGLGNGTTQFTRTYNNNTVVTLTAPATVGGNNFNSWTGCNSTSGTTCYVTMDASKTVTANYGQGLLMGGAIQGRDLNMTVANAAVTTFAGSAGNSGSADGTGSAARFYYPGGITTDGTNLYVADVDNHTIRKIVIATGAVTTLAGSAGNSGSADGTGSAARFYLPYGITTDGTNLYVADPYNYTIRKIVIATGAVTTLAGSAGNSGSTDGTGSAARFYLPSDITTDGTNLYVTDTYNYTIRKIVIATGTVTTLAGSAKISGSADGTGSAARFYSPYGITTDGTSLYVADTYNYTIRKISTGSTSTNQVLIVSSSNPASGVSITVSPNDNSGLGDGTTQFTRTYNNGTQVTLTAPATAGGNNFSSWTGCGSTSGTTCYVTMDAAKTVTANYATPPRVLTVSSTTPASGVSITVSLTDNNGQGNGITQFTRTYNNNTLVTLSAPATAGGNSFSSWTGCGSTSGTTCYVTMDAAKTVTANFTSPDGVTILATGLSNPADIAVDDTSVYWAEYGSGTVKKVSKDGGAATTLVSGLYSVSGIAIDVSYVYFAENVGINAANIKKISKSGGSSTTLASGQPSAWKVTVDGANVYWTDGYGGTIRKVPINGGSVSILATGSTSPDGIVVDNANVYWSEFDNPGAVRKVTIQGGVVTTLASNSNSAGISVASNNVYWTENVWSNNGKLNQVSVNGGNITNLAAGLNRPWDLAIDDTSAYVVENNVSVGTVKQIPLVGGGIITLASGLAEPLAVATDGTNVYWIERNGGGNGTGTVKKILKNTIVTYTLTVNSTNPTSGVAITATPNDNIGQGNGSTQFTRTYNNNTIVTLTAPATVSGNNFSSWTGCTSTSGATCTVTMDAAKTVTANYTIALPIPGPVTLQTTGGVTISASTRVGIDQAIKGKDVTLPIGGFSFTLNNVPAGNTTVLIIIPPAEAFNPANPESFVNADGTIKRNLSWYAIQGGNWTKLSNVPIELDLVAKVIRVTLRDGGPEDDDGVANGRIAAQGAPGVNIQGLWGDINGDGHVDLADAILALKIVGGISTVGQSIDVAADVNGDGKIGLEEVIFVLQNLAGLRK